MAQTPHRCTPQSAMLPWVTISAWYCCCTVVVAGKYVQHVLLICSSCRTYYEFNLTDSFQCDNHSQVALRWSQSHTILAVWYIGTCLCSWWLVVVTCGLCCWQHTCIHVATCLCATCFWTVCMWSVTTYPWAKNCNYASELAWPFPLWSSSPAKQPAK